MNRNPLFKKVFSILLFCLCLEIFLRLGVPLSRMYYWAEEKIIHSQQDVYRIMCLGESITFGGGEHSYPRELERTLNAGMKTKVFQVNNQGIPGRTTNEILKVLDDVLQKQRPDLVILMLGVHDVVFGKVVEDNWRSWLKLNVLSKSELYLVIRDLKSGLWAYVQNKRGQEVEPGKYIQSLQDEAVQKARDLETGAVPKGACKEDGMDRVRALLNPHPLMVRNYNEIIETILSKNIKVFVMQYPSVSIEPLKAMIRSNVVVFVGNEENFKEAKKRYAYEDLFSDCVGGVFGHFTPAGARLVAENLTQPILNFCSHDEKCSAILRRFAAASSRVP